MTDAKRETWRAILRGMPDASLVSQADYYAAALADVNAEQARRFGERLKAEWDAADTFVEM